MVLDLAPPVFIRGPELSADERRAVDALLNRLTNFQRKNALKRNYYRGRQRVRDLGIAIPPHLRTLEAVVGWPGMAVDVLEERLDHDGWSVPGRVDDFGIGEIVTQNKLRREFRAGHLAAMKYGIAFGVVGAGRPGEPSPLVTIESPRQMTALWDRRRRRVTEALLVSTDDLNEVTGATLWLAGEMLELRHTRGRWTVEDRHTNPLGRPPVVALFNRYDEEARGRSEITPALRTLTDNAVRTVLGTEIAREFFASPQRWIMGASESAFQDEDGNPKTAWETYLGKVLALEADGDGELPKVGSFAGNSPAPYWEQMRGLAQMVAAESALPISYLGLVHDANPASADAALVGEGRLNKRAERRQEDFGEDEGELMRLALWVRDGRDPGVTPRPNWRPAATPTLAAAADATSKLVESGILPPDSDLTLERIGMSETDRARLADDRRRARARETLTALSQAAQNARADAQVVELSERRGDAGAS